MYSFFLPQRKRSIQHFPKLYNSEIQILSTNELVKYCFFPLINKDDYIIKQNKPNLTLVIFVRDFILTDFRNNLIHTRQYFPVTVS